MTTNGRGTFVIHWAQTELDGAKAPRNVRLRKGMTWQFKGDAVRVDGADSVAAVGRTTDQSLLNWKASRSVRRFMADHLELKPGGPQAGLVTLDADEKLFDRGFVLTDGTTLFPVALIPLDGVGGQGLVFTEHLPEAGEIYWVHKTYNCEFAEAHVPQETGGVICFTTGTRIRTPEGDKAVEDIHAGDMVLTRDSGPQPISWTGKRHMSGARQYAIPALRPIRIRAGALDTGEPDGDLLVSPEHRMLIRGPMAELLFHEHEVLVTAKDLINDSSIHVNRALQDTCYHHIMFEEHHVVWANGVASESFHPGDMALDQMDEGALTDLCAAIGGAVSHYGQHARRDLTASEAAVLKHAMMRG